MKNEITSKKTASKAARLLRDPDTPEDVRSVAGSALTQRVDKAIARGPKRRPLKCNPRKP